MSYEPIPKVNSRLCILRGLIMDTIYEHGLVSRIISSSTAQCDSDGVKSSRLLKNIRQQAMFCLPAKLAT